MSDSPRHKNAGQPPVSTHPAFPVIVALWFAALLGIGSMVLPLEMFERFAVASGLADAYEAARPPLGATARIIVALVAGAIGAVAGIAIARRIAAAHKPQATLRRAAAMRSDTESRAKSAKRPISAHEELGEGGLDADEEEPFRASGRASGQVAGRRRALAVTEESAPSEFLDFAPVPGQRSAEEPLDLLAFEATEPAPQPEPEPELEEAAAPIAASPLAFGSATLSAPPASFGAPATFMTPTAQTVRYSGPAPAPAAQPESAESATPLAERALNELGVVELIERFALALQRHREAPEAQAESEEQAPVSLEEQAEAASPPAFSRPSVDDVAPVAAMPAALRPIGFDDDEDEADLPELDFATAFAKGRTFAEPAPEPLPAQEPVADDSDEREEIAEEGYTSLLAMKSPVGLSREPVRIDDDENAGTEPVVVFPGQAIRRAAPAADGPAREAAFAPPPAQRPFDAPLARAEQAAAAAPAPSFAPTFARAADPGETERALRDALEKLQKLSGAA